MILLSSFVIKQLPNIHIKRICKPKCNLCCRILIHTIFQLANNTPTDSRHPWELFLWPLLFPAILLHPIIKSQLYPLSDKVYTSLPNNIRGNFFHPTTYYHIYCFHMETLSSQITPDRIAFLSQLCYKIYFILTKIKPVSTNIENIKINQQQT